MGSVSQNLLPTEGLLDTDAEVADDDKPGLGEVEVEGADTEIRDGAPPGDEDFADKVVDINFGGPGFSWTSDPSVKQDGGLDS